MLFAFYKGHGAIVDRAIRWWQRGPYSHVEAVLADHDNGTFECASSSRDTGVRIATLALPAAEWDVLEMPADVDAVRGWFETRTGAGYDWFGIFGFVLRPVIGEPGRYFCSEAIASALGINEPWRLDPNGFADLVAAIARCDRTAA
ncbi:hypothetical protein [Burkholderia vietnamiensis]|uniref:hypothetical protein n=1 Tax=Burkholderia vietnamiensis TaxID=60552 RepID=UPI000841C0A4|nr:hypothetical protein [Burkholderia vietnamiensis]AOJ13140.1 hypothetical protein WJ02_05845 [Burkholderia vietnamiensis]